MPIIKAGQAREFGSFLAFRISNDPTTDNYAFLAPLLAEKIPFHLLDLIGAGLSECPYAKLDVFLDEIATCATLGGWTVIASALRQRLSREMRKSLDRTHAFIVRADTWYACDCFGERVLGQALVDEFETALKVFSSWRVDQNRWVRRSLGVAGHLWAKRARDALDLTPRVIILPQFYKPMLSERLIDAAEGVGWALKTLGRYYPDILIKFLDANWKRIISPVILRKALKFFPEEMKRSLVNEHG